MPAKNPDALRKFALAALLVGGLLIVGSTIRLFLAYDPRSGAEPPNVTDWMQGWGSLGGVLFGALAAGAAAAVYFQAKRDAQVAHERWMQERAEAEANAREAEQRWREERATAERQWHQQFAQLQRTAEAAEQQAQLRRDEQQQALLAVPRAVRLERVAVGHGERGVDRGLSHANHHRAFRIFVSVYNAGDQPISHVNALITFKPDNVSFGATEPVIYGKDSKVLTWSTTRDKPQRLSIVEPALWDFDTAGPHPLWSVALHFTDITGRTWRRVDNGPPSEVPTGQLP